MCAFQPLWNQPKAGSPSARVRPFLAWGYKNVLIGIIGIALAGSVTGWFRGAFDEILRATLPSVSGMACEMRETILVRWPLASGPPRPADKFTILMATLGGDDPSRSNTHAVELAFQGQDGIERIDTCRVLAIDGVGSGAERRAINKGRAWLAQRHADLLIWGEVLENKKVVDLHFIAPGAVSGAGSSLKPSPFRLEINLLNEDFTRAAAAQLTAVALGAIQPAAAQRGDFLADTLRPVAARLKHLAEEPPQGISAAQRANIQRSLGIALLTAGAESGRKDEVLDAAVAFRAALKDWPRERAPREWAMTQNDLGRTLLRLGAWEKGTESGTAWLDEAVQLFREALKDLPRERFPLDWAMTQDNLGAALLSLGEGESATEQAHEAVQAFREALTELTRERYPLAWAGTQNNLGRALLRLGQQDEAIQAYREALKEATRERAPRDWAIIQTNLANAVRHHAEGNSGTAHLEEALQIYREVLKERSRERVPLGWASTQNDLGNTLVSLGQQESGTARLKEAVQAHREALKEGTRERVPLAWAHSQKSLGYALRLLGVRESGTVRLEEAVQAYREALKEATRERVPLAWAQIQNGLGLALSALGERQVVQNRLQGCATLEEARAAYAGVREVRESLPRRNIKLLTEAMARAGCGG